MARNFCDRCLRIQKCHQHLFPGHDPEQMNGRALGRGKPLREIAWLQDDRLPDVDLLNERVRLTRESGERLFPLIGLGVFPRSPYPGNPKVLAFRHRDLILRFRLFGFVLPLEV